VKKKTKYQEVFDSNISILEEIKVLRNRRKELLEEINKPEDRYLPELHQEFGQNLQDESLLYDILLRDIEEVYYGVPFGATRKQGKEAFYNLVNNHLDS
jgi:hypothetical protein